jgi:2'-5' RNA ligase
MATPPPAQSALIVPVPQAEAVVADLRARHDASAALGVPAHITVLFPFVPPSGIDAAVLARVQAAVQGVRAFAFTLSRTGRFAQTLYLAPDPAAPFAELTQRLVAEFGQYPPYGGVHSGVVPHLTVAQAAPAGLTLPQDALAAALRRHGPIAAVCRRVVLIENTTGRWATRSEFDLSD